MRKRFFLISTFSLLLICSFVIFYFIYSNKNNQTYEEPLFKYNDNGTVTLGSGMIANGFRDSITNKILDSGTLINLIDGKVKGKVSFSQNLEGEQNYLLIFMVDFVQHEFNVDGISYLTYPFSLNGIDDIYIDIELILIDNNSREIEYIIIREPDAMELSIENKDEWNKIFITSQCFTWRLYLNESIDDEYNELDIAPNSGMHLTKDLNELTILPNCDSMDKVHLCIGNTSDEDIDYFIVAFLGWKQVPLSDNNMMKLIKIPPKSNIYYTLSIPNIENNMTYQVFAFPKSVNTRLLTLSSMRTIVSSSE